jgi:hypothetical protein
MAKTYRVTSETINFSLVVPDDVTYDEVKAEVRQIAAQIVEQQHNVIQSGQWTRSLSQVADEEDEDASTMLGRLVADYYRSQS